MISEDQMSPEIRAWIKEVDSRPLWVPPTGDVSFEWPESWCHVSHVVGCYSEAFEEASYNDDSILSDLVAGKLLDQAKWKLSDTPDRFLLQLEGLDIKDGRYDLYLMEAVLAAGGWPHQWCECTRLGPYIEKLRQPRTFKFTF